LEVDTKRSMVAPTLDLPLGALRADEFESHEFPRIGWLVDEIWRMQGCGFVSGLPKTLKSFLGLDMAMAIVSNNSFLARKTSHPGAVIYVDAESTSSDLQERIRMLRLGRNLSQADIRDLVVCSRPRLRLDESLIELTYLMREVQPDLTYLDPLVRLHGLDENSSRDMNTLLSDLKGLGASYGSGICIVHHFGKPREGSSGPTGQRMRGSSDFHAWLDSALYTIGSKPNLKVEFEQRSAAELEPMPFRVEFTTNQARVVFGDDATRLAAKSPTDHRIIEFLRTAKGTPSITAISEGIRRSRTWTSKEIEALKANGRVIPHSLVTDRNREVTGYTVPRISPDQPSLEVRETVRNESERTSTRTDGDEQETHDTA
jgi:AAA domain